MNFDSENFLAWKIVSLNSEEVDCEDVDDLDAVEQQRVLHLRQADPWKWKWSNGVGKGEKWNDLNVIE